MYQNTVPCNAPQSSTCDQPKEFDQVVKYLESEGSRLYNITNELIRKADTIMRFVEHEVLPEKPSEPKDFLTKVYHELNMIRQQNEKLQYLLEHLNKII
jgi:hypothetical protein